MTVSEHLGMVEKLIVDQNHHRERCIARGTDLERRLVEHLEKGADLLQIPPVGRANAIAFLSAARLEFRQ